MTTILNRTRRAARLLVQVPSIGVTSLAYSIIIHLTSIRADLLDIDDPWWVVTVGLVLLLSPVYHAFVIGRTAASVTKQAYSFRSVSTEAFGDLVLGELLVNACVILGAALFLLPGIYVGLRSIYYKQIIVLHKARSMAAIRMSFRMTIEPRVILQMFLLLSVAYCIPLAIGFWLTPVTQALWAHLMAVLVSASFIAWVNVYITLSFNDLVARSERIEGT